MEVADRIEDPRTRPPLDPDPARELEKLLASDLAQARHDILDNRSKEYGDATFSNTALGHIWAGLLSAYYRVELPPIPPHVCQLMMAVSKAQRIAQGGSVADSYADLMNYVEQSYCSMRKTEDGKPEPTG